MLISLYPCLCLKEPREHRAKATAIKKPAWNRMLEVIWGRSFMTCVFPSNLFPLHYFTELLASFWKYWPNLFNNVCTAVWLSCAHSLTDPCFHIQPDLRDPGSQARRCSFDLCSETHTHSHTWKHTKTASKETICIPISTTHFTTNMTIL